MQKYFILFWLCIACLHVQAVEISESECLNKNFEQRFGPMIYQGDTNYCWAFAAAQLVEDHLCRLNPESCGKSISRLDISSCHFKLGMNKPDQVGHTEDALQCALEQGVCEEKHAPFDVAALQLKNLKPNSNYSEMNAYLKKTFIPPHCAQNKLQLKVQSENYSILKSLFGLNDEDFSTKKEAALAAFQENRSWSAGICLERWREPGRKIKMSECDRHAVVVDGMSWNANKSRCELHVRNSIATSKIKHWVDANQFIDSVFSMIRLTDLPAAVENKSQQQSLGSHHK